MVLSTSHVGLSRGWVRKNCRASSSFAVHDILRSIEVSAGSHHSRLRWWRGWGWYLCFYRIENSRSARSPCFPQADEVTAKLFALHQYALGMPIPVLPLYSHGAHIVGRYRQLTTSAVCPLSPQYSRGLSCKGIGRRIGYGRRASFSTSQDVEENGGPAVGCRNEPCSGST